MLPGLIRPAPPDSLIGDVLKGNVLKSVFDFSAAAWATDISGTGVSPVVTADYGVAPDGSASADRIQLDRGASTGFSRIQQTPVSVSSSTWTFSVWLKTTDGSTKTVGLRINATGALVTVNGTWTKLSVTGAASGANGASQILSWSTLGGSQAVDLLAWGARLTH